MEVARSKEGVVASQQKYILDLLKETVMCDSKPAGTPVECNLKLGNVDREEAVVDVGRYQSLRRGSVGIVGLMLLNSRQLMHAPITQDHPLMTEDMHDERLQAVEAFGSSTYVEAAYDTILMQSLSQRRAGLPCFFSSGKQKA